MEWRKILAAAVFCTAVAGSACGAGTKESADEAWARGENVACEGSDLIGWIGYDAEARVLRVQFIHSSDWYLYQDVPAETAEAFFKSESKGTFFGRRIKGRFEYVREE